MFKGQDDYGRQFQYSPRSQNRFEFCRDSGRERLTGQIPPQHDRGDNYDRSSQYNRRDNYDRPPQHDKADNYGRPPQHDKGDNYGRLPQHDKGDNYSRPPQHDKGDNYGRPPQHDKGDNYGRPPQHDKGDNYGRPSQYDKGDNYSRLPQHDKGDNYGRPPQHDKGDNDRFEENEKRFYEFTQSSRNPHLWKDYLSKLNQIENDLKEEYAYYQQNPNRHPKYESVWKEFYNERTEDLLRKGENPKNHDMNHEFFSYWDLKLREIFKNIFQNERAQLQQQLEYSQGQSSKITTLQQNDCSSRTSSKQNYGSVNDNNFDLPQKASKQMKLESQDSVKVSSEKPSMIHILRNLTVLENYLGSLGPKVVDLLSKALILEKSSSSDSILSNEENCLLLETVKEKLKGLLQAGLLPQSAITATVGAIYNIDNVLTWDCSKKSNENESFLLRKSNENKEPKFNERRGNESEGNFNLDDRKDVNKGEPYDTEKKFYDDKNLSYDYERDVYHKDHSFKDRNMFKDQTVYKVSGIRSVVENQRSLEHLSNVEKNSLIEEITSTLISQQRMEILEDEILDLIKDYSTRKQNPRDKFLSDSYFGDSSDIFQRRPRGYDQLPSLETTHRTTSVQKIHDNYSSLDSLYKINQNNNFSQRKETFLPRGYSSYMTPITYPLNSNPYQSGSRRKY